MSSDDRAYQEALAQIKRAEQEESTSLNLSSLGLTTLPPEITQLTSLTLLYLRNNGLITLPPEITQLTSLTTLNLAGNGLTTLPPEITQLTSLTELNLGYNQLTTLPPEISQLTSLTSLNLAGSGFTTLPPEITQLTSLTSLNLLNNKLTTLPPEITQLTSLTSLDLRNNGLTTLPPEITQLTSLTELNLGYNQLTTLPPEISQLTSLTLLYLRNNGLITLPPEISQLTSLTTLNLAGNGLTTLPPEIGNLTKLERLDLEGNKITKLPRQLFDLNMSIVWGSGKGVDLNKNLLEVPPLEIAKQGIEAVRAYFEDIEAGETTQLFEAKLLIVGQGNVGKTYLKNRLMHGAVDPATVRTEGIDIDPWMIATRQTERFRVNFWDFGGQEILKATHQFFLTKRSLYLFVWEARTDADLLSFDYWLNTIEVLSDASPVLIVQSKVDEWKKPINQAAWKKRFPNVVNYYDVSATKGTGIEALKAAITHAIEALPHIGDLLPKRWTDIRRALEALDVNFIPYARYQEICAAHQMDDAQADRLSEYYHDLGVFLHFKDNPILHHTIFLKPEWATHAVYTVIENEVVKENNGLFRYDQLGAVWEDKTAFPPDKHLALVELMKSFELCFELPAGQAYIIPELLRANQPEAVEDWDEAQNLRFQYVYDFMPSGVMTRFIVRTHDLIDGDLYWKDGVVLARENTHALIVKTDNLVIDVWIRGADKQTLLGMIRRDMDYIHAPFSNLDVSEMVPCLCDECSVDAEPHFYDYQYLLKARKKRADTLCKKSDEMIAIDHLLSGIGPKAPEGRTQRIKLFLGSTGKLKEEREQLELLIRRENKRLFDENIFLDLVIWEEEKKSFHTNGFQKRLNEILLQCDIAVFLFFIRIGPFTKEEYDVAFTHFNAGNKPRHLFVFFKSGGVDDIDAIDPIELQKRQALKKEIEEAKQIYISFDSNKDLLLQLQNQLALIIREMTA